MVLEAVSWHDTMGLIATSRKSKDIRLRIIAVEKILDQSLASLSLTDPALALPPTVTGAPYREVNSKVATTPKLKVEDKDRVNNSRRIKTVKLNIVKLKALLNKFSRGKVGYRSRMPNA